MIMKTKEDVMGTKGEVCGDKWRSLRFLHAEDGMGISLTDTILEPGFEMNLWQKTTWRHVIASKAKARWRSWKTARPTR